MDDDDDGELVLRQRNDLRLMRTPARWPGTIYRPEARLGGPLTDPALALKNYALREMPSGIPQFAVLVWYRSPGEYGFVPEGATAATRKGGDELLVELVKEGWLVD